MLICLIHSFKNQLRLCVLSFSSCATPFHARLLLLLLDKELQVGEVAAAAAAAGVEEEEKEASFCSRIVSSLLL